MSYDFATELNRAIQTRLKGLGYYQGFLDGKYGPMMSMAVSQFKGDNGYVARDLIGEGTLFKLFDPAIKSKPAPKSVAGEPLWITEAKQLVGTTEVAGSANNPVIMGWAKDLDQWYPGDDIPWCGLFVAHCMAYGSPDTPQNFNRLGARAWLNYGGEASKMYGVIAIFWRTHKTQSSNGHVGFLVGEDADTYHILGGNQSNTVNVTRVSKSRLLGFRAPAGYTGSTSLKSVTTAQLSTNEA